jgi:hypothetical protein
LRADAAEIAFVDITRLRVRHQWKDKSKAKDKNPEFFVQHVKWLPMGVCGITA